jgi:hypothetical protein
MLESRWFIEWTALELEVAKAAELINLQVLLALWDLESRQHWHDERWRNQLADKAREWTQRVLEMSGLLTPRIAGPQSCE